MTRVVHFYQPGPPEVQRIEDIEVPAPGAGEVQSRVASIGMNRSDLLFRAGQHPMKPPVPAGNGAEAAGVVEALGPGVEAFAVGDAVSVVPHMNPRGGTYGELINVRATMVMPSSPQLSTRENGAFWASALTAFGGLVDVGGLVAGDTVVIPAASSSVGVAAIQIARFIGALPVALTRRADKAERLRQLGAARVLVEGRDDYTAAVMEVSGGRGARVVFDPVAGAGVPRLAAAMATRGIYVLYGAMSGEMTPFPVAEAFDKLLTMGIFRLDYVNRPDELARGRAFLDAALAAGHLKPLIDREFPLARVVDAHHYMAANDQIGKILLIP